MSIYRLSSWVKEIGNWLAEGKIVLMFILVISAAVILGIFTWSSEASIRTAGYALQLIGMLFAVRGLISIRAHFKQTPLRKMFLNWLKRFPKWKRHIVISVEAMNGVVIKGSEARLSMWVPDKKDNPIETRIEDIVRNIEIIRDDQRKHSLAIDKLNKDHEEYREKATEEVKKVKDNFHYDQESLHTNDLIASLFGLIILTVGITMSTMAPEIYEWIK